MFEYTTESARATEAGAVVTTRAKQGWRLVSVVPLQSTQSGPLTFGQAVTTERTIGTATVTLWFEREVRQ